jgi:protein-S-isoprenylcysteine O-methyltransferase Ste14
VLALTVDSAKNIALLVLAGVLVVGFLAFKITNSVTQKAMSLLLTMGVLLGVWTQRSNVSSCADKVRAQAASGSDPDTTCTFFGTEIDISVDSLTGS